LSCQYAFDDESKAGKATTDAAETKPEEKKGWFGNMFDGWGKVMQGSWSAVVGDPNIKKGTEAEGYYSLNSNWWQPQNSLITSVAFACIPGVIYNLQKARVIDCQYILCLKNTKYGVPLYLCASQREYSYCRYVWGQIFNVVPFASAISGIGQNVLKALSHPLELVGAGISALCTVQCEDPVMPGCNACTWIDLGNKFLDVLCDLGIGAGHCEPIWDQLTVNSDVCDEALKDDNKDKKSDKDSKSSSGCTGPNCQDQGSGSSSSSTSESSGSTTGDSGAVEPDTSPSSSGCTGPNCQNQ
jgi:hypothetical protein